MSNGIADILKAVSPLGLTSERVYQRGDVLLLNVDCLDAMPLLPSIIDAFITSPPYNLGNTSGGDFPPIGHYDPNAGYAARGGGGKWRRASMNGGIAHGYGSHGDNMPHEEYVAWQHKCLSEMWRSLGPSGAIFYNHKPRIFSGRCITPLDYNPNLPLRQIVIWARAGGINFSPAFYVPTHEWLCVFARDDFRLKSKGASGVGDVWYIPQESNSIHPAPFPIDLPLRVLDTTAAELVCDPFSGSATTAAACIKMGRAFVGFELDPGHFAAARDRLDDEFTRTSLLEPPPPRIQSELFTNL